MLVQRFEQQFAGEAMGARYAALGFDLVRLLGHVDGHLPDADDIPVSAR